MSKVAILSYGHVDPILPLFQRISQSIDTTLILVFSQKAKRESILSFEDIPVRNGFQESKTNRLILDKIGLAQETNRIRIFIYHNNRIRSIQNTYLSFKLAIELRKYDLIHFNGQHTTFNLLYYFLYGIKKLFVIHDYKPHTGEGGTSYLFSCYYTNKFILRTKWPVIIQNKYDFELIKKELNLFENKLFYIPFGAFENYLHWFNPEIKQQKYDLLFFGRISLYKGIDYLLEAMIKIQSQRPATNLCIAGSGNLETTNLKKLDLKNVTVFNQYIDSRFLVELIQNSKIVVCPYTDATQSGVAMTAFAFNKPVIASAVGGFPDIIEDGKNGYLVPPKDSAKLADAILRSFKDELVYDKMKENIIDFKNNSSFSWDKITKMYLQLYISILNSK